MGIALALLSLIAGVAALVRGLFFVVQGRRGWNQVSGSFEFLVGWLPVISTLSLVMLCTTAARAGWHWTSVIGLIVFSGGVQMSLLVLGCPDRVAFSFMPAVLIGLASIALTPGGRPDLSPLLRRLGRAAPVLAVIGAAGVAASFGVRGLQLRRLEERLATLRAADERSDATLHGLERAAWLLGREFSASDGFHEADFLRTRCYRRPRESGEYRWLDDTQQLLVTVTLFGESFGLRDRLLPIADRVLQTAALAPGPRPDLGGGVLRCEPPLHCTVTWELDVDRIHPPGAVLRPSVSQVEWRAWNEVTAAGR